MRFSALQIGLVLAGLALVAGVVIANWLQLRRARRRREESGRPALSPRGGRAAGDDRRIEPTLSPIAPTSPGAGPAGDAFEIPMDEIAVPPVDEGPPTIAPTPRSAMAGAVPPTGTQPQPDPEIESVATLQPAKPVAVGTLAAGLHARVGKPLRWFGRREGESTWQRLTGETAGEFSEIAACLLLADRNGAASRAQIEAFQRVVSELAPMLPAAWSAAPADEEADRAEELDRLCAEIDMQIGLTIQKSDGGIAGTKLRGVAEASGFRLAPGGRFECVHEDTGAVLYSLQSAGGEPFTIESLRTSTLAGVVLVLDVPRVADPARAFDQLKLAAKRMAHTLAGELVDDNRRPLTDAALAAIREQVVAAAGLLVRAQIEPGSPRAHKLFAA